MKVYVVYGESYSGAEIHGCYLIKENAEQCFRSMCGSPGHNTFLEEYDIEDYEQYKLNNKTQQQVKGYKQQWTIK